MWTTWLACANPEQPAVEDSAPRYVSETYDGQNWLCRPDQTDACDGDLDVTAVSADGSQTPAPFVAAEEPAADCFFVYPTTSLDPGTYSDLEPGPEETFVATYEAARYQSVCALYAPMYRQVTVAGLFEALGSVDFEPAYDDVLDAWRHFLDNDSRGRPFLLVGHSQGSVHLARLIADEIEGTPLADRLVAAHLIGGFVEVPVGGDVGGTFASTPLCRSPSDTGCVVHYNTFRAEDPPGDDAFFGVPATPGNEIACTHPGALAGGPAPLSTILPTEAPDEVSALIGVQQGPYADPSHPAVPTPYYAVPGLIHGECARTPEGAAYLSVTVDADPADPRTDEIGGDLLPGWGLHLVDVPLALGDLVALAETQLGAR